MSKWQTERHIMDLEKQLEALQRDAAARYSSMKFSEVVKVRDTAKKLKRDISVLKASLKRE